MNPIETQQATLDNALVLSEKRLKIERYNARIAFSKPQKEETYQVTLEALRLSLFYLAFVITAEICPKILNKDFIAPPLEEDLVTFIQELSYYGRCNMLFAIDTDQMHQPWRAFATIINRCYNKKNVDYVALLWEDFMYQADNRYIGLARKEHMPYPRFTKVIINHFISKDKTISMRNRINLYTICDALLLDIKDSSAYNTYYDFATVPPRKARKYKKVASPLRKLSPVKEAKPIMKDKRVKRPTKKSTATPTAGVAIKDTPSVSISKNKATAKDFHISQARGSCDGTDLESGVPDEQQSKTSCIDEGTGTKPGVLDVPKYQSKSENESWGDSEDDNDDDSNDVSKGDDDKADSDDDGNSDADDNERTGSDDDDENPSFNLKDYDEEEHDKETTCKKERKGNEEMTDADQNVSQDQPYEQVVEDAHMTLTSSQKTKSSKQSSCVSSNFASKFLILENIPPTVDEFDSMMNVKSRQEESSTQSPSLCIVPKTTIPKTSTTHATTVPLTILMITPLP
ncbi:hypothetical protein Tco_0901858 [Tanacetum coccineum]